MNVVRYSIYHPSKLKYSNIKLRARFAPIVRRGSKANEDMGILQVYSGTAMHDGWSSYFKFNCKHALCNSHNLRDLTFVHEEDKQNWAKELIDH
ncbi:MAG: transposase, partial [Methanothrix sp.]